MCGALSGQPQTRMQKTGEERTRATVRSKTSNEGLTSKLGTLSIGAGSEEAAVRGGASESVFFPASGECLEGDTTVGP